MHGRIGMNFWQGKLQWEPQESNDTADSQWGWEARGLIWMPLGYLGGGAFRKRTSGLLRVMAGHPWDSKMGVQAFTSVCSRGEQWLRADSSVICASPLTSRAAAALVSKPSVR